MPEYIDRESLLKILNDDILKDSNCPLFIAATVDQIVSLMPAADVEPVKHGQWVKKYHKNCLGDYFQTHCSECDVIKPVASHTNYCPNCGAKMDKK